MSETNLEHSFHPLNKGKLMILSIGSIGIMIASFFMIFMGSESAGFKKIYLSFAGILGIVVFAYIFMTSMKKMIDEKGGITLSPEGFDDRSSLTSVGQVTWQEVTGIDIIKINGLSFLRIKVENPDKIINRHTGLKQALLKKNNFATGSPIQIPSSGLSTDFDELVKEITAFYRKYSGKA